MIVLMSSGEPQGKDGNQKIRDKCKQYLDRVEELQEYLANKEVVANAYKHTYSLWNSYEASTAELSVVSISRFRNAVSPVRPDVITLRARGR